MAEHRIGHVRVDVDAVAAAITAHEQRSTAGTGDIAAYHRAQTGDPAHRDVIGPLLPATGPGGVVLVGDRQVASWGDPTAPEMAFSATKTMLSVVAGTAFDDGALVLDDPVSRSVDLAPVCGPVDPRITWRHLLQQTSGWDGELWGKPTWVDAQSGGDPPGRSDDAAPGTAWAYNDVRVNLLALALTVLLDRPLPEVFARRIAAPLGLSSSWSWHGYTGSTVADRAGARLLPVVSGGAHWGGGMWISAADLAIVGRMCLLGGRVGDRVVLSPAWLRASWTPCAVKRSYGLLW